jgi:hypothetical protein
VGGGSGKLVAAGMLCNQRTCRGLAINCNGRVANSSSWQLRCIYMYVYAVLFDMCFLMMP